MSAATEDRSATSAPGAHDDVRFAEDLPGIQRGSFQTQLLHSFPQVLVIDLEDNSGAIVGSRKNI